VKKKLYLTLLFSFIILTHGCQKNNENGDNGTVDYKQEMRNFVRGISEYAKGIQGSFLIVPQNGQELLTEDGEETGPPSTSYISSIDGVGREDLFYGYDGDNIPTPETECDYLMAFLDIAENNGVEALVTDYCWTQSYIDDSYLQNETKGYISFAADHRELDSIPLYPSDPYNVNSSNVTTLENAQNFLYLINTSQYSDKSSFLTELSNTNFDLLILDFFFNDSALTSNDIATIRSKSNGGMRILLAYMSIGEAEDYRYYWNSNWETNPPEWLAEENPNWEGNFKVRYWYQEWQDIIYGNSDSYLYRILDAGFDGVYLDIIDAFEYFEDQHSSR
jgi:cysteinyl-tRNA synthetase